MKKATFFLILGIIAAGAVLLASQRPAYAGTCTSTVACTYFTENFAPKILENVLNPPALSGVNSPGSLISVMQGYLYGSDYHQRVGAAFLVDNMLNYRGVTGRPAGGGISAGVAYAQNATNWNNWKALVYFYAAGGSGQGITWAYWPSKAAFCDNGNNIDSGWDTAYNEPAIYHVYPYKNPDGSINSTCTYEYNESMPEIHFFWPGGSFDIGQGCGNIQHITNNIPSPNHPPYGDLSVVCSADAGQFVATINNYGDQDGATSAQISTSVGGWTGTYSSAPPVTNILIPQSQTDPYTPVTVYLKVRDVGVFGDQLYHQVDSVSTSSLLPCAQVGCSIKVTPTNVVSNPIDPYMHYTAVVTVTNNVNQTPAGTVDLQITSPSGGISNYSKALPGGSGSSASVTFANLGPPLQAGTFGTLGRVTSSTLNVTCPGNFPVVYLPYVNVYGGDVVVGTSPADAGGGASSCVENTAASAYSWNNRGPTYSGAGAQYAVEVLGDLNTPITPGGGDGEILDFASALSSSSPAPHSLSFANYYTGDTTKLNDSQGLFGGYFGGSGGGPYACDFTSNIGVAPVSGNQTIGATSVGLSQYPVKYVVNGDVYITGNITYAGSGGWGSVSQIPSFKLVVVNGDIYIGSGVTQLDGLYVAESSTGGAKGRIFTCATGMGAAANPLAAGYFTTCHNKLTVNGAFVAKQIWFGRTPGSVGQAAGDTLLVNHDAEVFNYTPELWLPRNSGPPANGYAAIAGLPPVL